MRNHLALSASYECTDLLDMNMTTVSRDGRRFYTLNGVDLYPSVTTVLGCHPDTQNFLENWKNSVGVDHATQVSKRASSRGNAMHEALEHIVRHGSIDPTTIHVSARGLVKQVVRRLNEFNPSKVLVLEGSVFSDRLRTAGRVDLALRVNDELNLVVDFKSSSKPKKLEWIQSYVAQCEAYATGIEECFGIKIHGCAILIGVDGAQEAQKFMIPRIEMKPYRSYFERAYDGFEKRLESTS